MQELRQVHLGYEAKDSGEGLRIVSADYWPWCDARRV